MQELIKICVHHSAGTQSNPLLSTQNISLKVLNEAHRVRWPDFKSSLGYFVGYNVVILGDGSFVQTRLLGTETAAAIGHNRDTFHILVAGNFTRGVDVPTDKQILTLRMILSAALRGREALHSIGIKSEMMSKLNFTVSRIYPHRVLTPGHTQCFGNSLPDDWARRLVLAELTPPVINTNKVYELQLSLIAKLKLLLLALQDELAKKKFGKMQVAGDRGEDCHCEVV